MDGLSQHSDAAFERYGHPEGARVLDIGCGFGDSTLRIAACVGPGGEAVGMDCAENFVNAADSAARDAGVTNARFFVADAQWGDLRGPYDHAFARFGTMFFEMPGAAMRNVRKALKPGGTFTQVVWRRREDNPWLHEAELRVKAIVPEVSHEETDQVHCGPGPFSMAGPDMVSTMLRSAGFERITFERFDCDICIGRDLDDAPGGRGGRKMQASGGCGATGCTRILCAPGRCLGTIEYLVYPRNQSRLSSDGIYLGIIGARSRQEQESIGVRSQLLLI